jgi:hypothetical protein
MSTGWQIWRSEDRGRTEELTGCRVPESKENQHQRPAEGGGLPTASKLQPLAGRTEWRSEKVCMYAKCKMYTSQ